MKRGDILVNGWWARSNPAIFDIVVTHTNAHSYLPKTPKKLLEDSEKKKKKEYLQACLKLRMHFTPFALSADGMLGYEANMTLKKLAKMRAEQTGSPYSSILNWIRTQISFDLVRSNFSCLYGSRSAWMNHRPKQAEEGVLFEAMARVFNEIGDM